MEFLKHTLDNGLDVVAECNDQAYSTALGFFVNTGARDEADDTAGVSHFLEHMAFKGTATRSADDVNREFDEMGAHYNAATGEEGTVFYAAVLPEYQNPAVELLGDILRPALREADFDTEKQVILEEIGMYEDQPPFGADEKCRAAHYGAHPLGRSVLGTEKSITDLSVDAMREYFGRRYNPGNITLVAAGRIDFDSLIATAGQACGSWESLEAGRLASRPECQPSFRVICKESATQQYAVLMADGPTADDEDRYAAKLLTTVLGDDTGSRLYWELVDPGLAEQVALSHQEFDAAGLFVTYLSCHPDLVADNLKRILDVYRHAEEAGIAADEVARAKSKISARLVLSSERPRGRLFAIGSDWVQRGRYRSLRDDLDTVAAITPDDIVAVLARCPLSQGSTMTIGPLAEVAAPQ